MISSSIEGVFGCTSKFQVTVADIMRNTLDIREQNGHQEVVRLACNNPALISDEIFFACCEDLGLDPLHVINDALDEIHFPNRTSDTVIDLCTDIRQSLKAA